MTSRAIVAGTVAAMFGVAVFARADFSLSDWRTKAPISGSRSAAEYVALELPPEFFSSIKPDLSDLRVVADGEEVAYAIGIEKEARVFTRLPAAMRNLSSVRGANTSFLVDLGSSGGFHNRISIITSSENFRRLVSIEGSDDGASWRTLTSRGQIFDYTVRDIKPVSVRDTSVSYPDATFRYLRVTIDDALEPPLAISGVEVSRELFSAAREISYSPLLEVFQNSAQRATDVVLDMGASGIPHRRGVLKTSSVNFSRQAAIYESDDAANWRLLANVYFYSIETPRFTGANLDFSYPESNTRYLKMSIQNGDDQPIAISGVSLFGVVRRIVFYFDPAKSYEAYLGNPDARRPQYDIERISQYLDASELSRASAGAVMPNPAFKEKEKPKPPLTERSPYLLPVVLGLVVAVLAFLALRLLGSVAKPPAPPA